MKTKNINTSYQIDVFKTKNKVEYGSQIYNEFALKEMIISCFTYGGVAIGSYNFDKYVKQYENKLGSELFSEIYIEQYNFLKNNCQIKHGVYTDNEGCTYNSLVKK